MPLFSACSKKELALVAQRAEDVKVEPGKVLVREGAAGAEFFVIIEGTAEVSRRGHEGRRARPGRLLRRPRAARQGAAQRDRHRGAPRWSSSCSASASSPALIDEVPGFAHKLLAGLARRLREYDAQTVQ